LADCVLPRDVEGGLHRFHQGYIESKIPGEYEDTHDEGDDEDSDYEDDEDDEIEGDYENYEAMSATQELEEDKSGGRKSRIGKSAGGEDVFAENENVEALSVVSTSESEGADPNKSQKTVSIDGSNGNESAEAEISSGGSRKTIHAGSERKEKQLGGKQSKANKGRNDNKGDKPTNSNNNSVDKAKRGQKADHLVTMNSTPQVNEPISVASVDKSRTENDSQRNHATEYSPSHKFSKHFSNKTERMKTGSKTGKKEAGILDKKSKTGRGKINSKTGPQSPSGDKKNHRREKYDTKSHDLLIDSGAQPLRPPPGLAPPPGFGGSQASTTVSSVTQAHLPFESSMENQPSLQTIPSPNPSVSPEVVLQVAAPTSSVGLTFPQPSSSESNLLFPGNLGEPPALAGTERNFSFAPPTPSAIPGLGSTGPAQPGDVNLTSASRDPPVLFPEENQNGFDVMDFLDSILNEGAPLDEPDEQANAGLAPGATLGGAGNATPILANPWATEGKSRASAYGISFDDDDDNSSDASPMLQALEGSSGERTAGTVGLGGVIPLLTPAAILNAGEDMELDEDENAVSFFAGLVDE